MTCYAYFLHKNNFFRKNSFFITKTPEHISVNFLVLIERVSYPGIKNKNSIHKKFH